MITNALNWFRCVSKASSIAIRSTMSELSLHAAECGTLFSRWNIHHRRDTDCNELQYCEEPMIFPNNIHIHRYASTIALLFTGASKSTRDRKTTKLWNSSRVQSVEHHDRRRDKWTQYYWCTGSTLHFHISVTHYRCGRNQCTFECLPETCVRLFWCVLVMLRNREYRLGRQFCVELVRCPLFVL